MNDTDYIVWIQRKAYKEMKNYKKIKNFTWIHFTISFDAIDSKKWKEIGNMLQ